MTWASNFARYPSIFWGEETMIMHCFIECTHLVLQLTHLKTQLLSCFWKLPSCKSILIPMYYLQICTVHSSMQKENTKTYTFYCGYIIHALPHTANHVRFLGFSWNFHEVPCGCASRSGYMCTYTCNRRGSL